MEVVTIARVSLMASTLAVMLVAARAFAGDFPDGLSGPRIAVIDQSKIVSAATLTADLPMFQLYIKQVCLAWHCSGRLYVAPRRAATRDWAIYLRDADLSRSSCHCDGYHTIGPRVAAFVYVIGSNADWRSWTTVFSHELAEMLVDAPGALGAQVSHPYQNDQQGGYQSPTVFYALEIADPVMDHYYWLGHVLMADFVYRSWFTPHSLGPWDALRETSGPLQLMPQGYVARFFFGSWEDIYGSNTGKRRRRA